MDSSSTQSPSKQSFTFELAGASGRVFVDGVVVVVVGGALVVVGTVVVVCGVVVEGADAGGCAVGAWLPQPDTTRAMAARTVI
ncbi:hypothetical protein ALI144C_41535 [Actinosynnema sp. ALI-1.44]|nr:hypothetical protein ALI144C_41535 [Actinosynnema sp. ALI-1.44]